jgi:uncharacterized protein YbaR (Trm112 family)
MTRQPSTPFLFDATIVSQLACPVCMRDLHLESERLVCHGCGRAYPIVGGIPILIAERAELSIDPKIDPR